MSILGSYDSALRAVLNPCDIIAPVEGMPTVAVATFARPILDAYLADKGGEQLAHSKSANGNIPVYKTNYGGKDIAFFLSPVGASAAAAMMEEAIAMGVSSFVYFGSCGALDAQLAQGHFIVPSAAARDEGTSYFYLPPSSQVVLEPLGVAKLAAVFERLGAPFTVAKTWTTDGLYRETQESVARRKADGCAVVEMECAALAAVAQFRGVRFAQFLFAEDTLDAASWQARTLLEHGAANAEQYMAAALECALAFF